MRGIWEIKIAVLCCYVVLCVDPPLPYGIVYRGKVAWKGILQQQSTIHYAPFTYFVAFPFHGRSFGKTHPSCHVGDEFGSKYGVVARYCRWLVVEVDDN